MPSQEAPQAEGRRTQLKIVRENIQTLSSDIGNFRRSHEFSVKKLEKQVAALRSDLAAQSVAKDVGGLRKSHDASAKKLEKQVETLRKELADLKGKIAKDAARSNARQEATLARILAKVSTKAPKPKSLKPKSSKKK
jgi:ribosomal protein L29